ncbi:MAG TPA: hypothetical protein PK668_17365 [Myxococcota bacterium]|nr:hypothetical protein [Myxococcota bacterium]HRY94930.1 hypothetical protein [Myxococcota bacterium]HSA24529.1 hypothetical protein [Myxococcota bacterium]
MKASGILGTALLSALLLAGAGCGSVGLEDLEQPVLYWDQRDGLCSQILAVDRSRTVWMDRGCEEPYDFGEQGGADEAEVETLRRAFGALPLAVGPDPLECDWGLHAFCERDHGSTRCARACRAGPGYDDTTGLEEPFLAAAQAFLALE